MYVYAQTEIVKDLFNRHEINGTPPLTGYKVKTVNENNDATILVTVTDDQQKEKTIESEFVAFCDGFRGAG